MDCTEPTVIKRLNRLVLFFASCALLTPCVLACVPVRVWEIPEVTGRVHRGHDPVAGAKVTWQDLDWTKNATTGQPAASALTNGVGEFAIAARPTWGAGMLLPADAIVKWRVQVEVSDRTSVLWQQRLLVPGRRSMPGRVRIDCDLAETPPCLLLDTDQPRLRPTGRRLPQE